MHDMARVFLYLDFSNLESCSELSGLVNHRAHAAILVFRESDRVFNCLAVYVNAAQDVVHSDLFEHHRRFSRLVSLDLHLVIGDVHALLSQDGNHVERRAPGESRGYQFNGFGSTRTVFVVDQQIMAATGSGDELPFVAKWLCESDFGFDHRYDSGRSGPYNDEMRQGEFSLQVGQFFLLPMLEQWNGRLMMGGGS